MDLKLKVKENFFKTYPNFTIDKTKIAIASFLGVMVFLILADYGIWEFSFIGLVANAVWNAILFTTLVYFVALAIEQDMFNTKNPQKLLDLVLITSIAVPIIVFVLAFISNNAYFLFDSYYSDALFEISDFIIPLFDALFAFLLVFFFGQILAIAIENGIKFNNNFTNKVTTIVFVSFLLIFGFQTAYHFEIYGFYFYWLGDALGPLFFSIALSIPILLIGYSLAVYVENNAPSLKRVPFGDDFSMELPEPNASLPNYGFEVQKPVSEDFGELKQWFGGNVSIKYFSFKNEQIKNEIMEDMKNIPNLERIPHNKYIIQKDNAENIINVFYFKDTYALNLFGRDMDLLLSLMDSVKFGSIQQAQTFASAQAAPNAYIGSAPVTPNTYSGPGGVAPSVSAQPSSSGSGIMPLKDKGLSLPANPVCDVCNRPLNVDKAWFVPNKVFYASQKYRQWNKDHFPLSETDAEFNMRMMMMENNDPTEGSAVCEDCINMFK